MKTKMCSSCGRQVGTKKRWSWSWFWILNLLFGAGIWLYVPVWLLFGRKVCVICESPV